MDDANLLNRKKEKQKKKSKSKEYDLLSAII
jgi:hypothetical protein